jgi:hypothetical protein
MRDRGFGVWLVTKKPRDLQIAGLSGSVCIQVGNRLPVT